MSAVRVYCLRGGELSPIPKEVRRSLDAGVEESAVQKKLEHPPGTIAEIPPLNPLKLVPGVSFSLSFRLLSVSRICRRRIALFCRKNFDLEPNLILILLAAGESHLHQGILAKSLGIDKNAMVFQIDKLEVRGLIKRIPNPDNRRARLIECTPKGKTLVAEIKSNYTQIVRWVLYPLSGVQIEQFGLLLAQIIEGETSLKSPVPLVRSKEH
jgi:DNA-binding MarR family transcriptional regulator